MLVFDLDDTLYQERDFVRSGFLRVAESISPERAQPTADRLLQWFDDGVANPFAQLIAESASELTLEALVRTYREHLPDIRLAKETRRFLQQAKDAGSPIGLITDGRSVTQRNKVRALGLVSLVDYLVVSEEVGSSKPSPQNYRLIESRFPGRSCVYIGDNLAKDFIAPNRLGWTTIGVRDRGFNIHPQDPTSTPEPHLPDLWVAAVA